MAMSVEEIRKWFRGMSRDTMIAISEGGLALVEVGTNEENYCEVGGEPLEEDEEDEVSQALTDLLEAGVIRKVGENYIMDKDGEAKLAELKLDELNRKKEE